MSILNTVTQSTFYQRIRNSVDDISTPEIKGFSLQYMATFLALVVLAEMRLLNSTITVPTAFVGTGMMVPAILGICLTIFNNRADMSDERKMGQRILNSNNSKQCIQGVFVGAYALLFSWLVAFPLKEMFFTALALSPSIFHVNDSTATGVYLYLSGLIGLFSIFGIFRPIAKAQLNQMMRPDQLNAWVKNEGGNSEQAVNKINECYLNQSPSLDLSSLSLKSLPGCIGHLSHLESLDLSGNHLRTLPENITKLAKLTVLNLSNNRKLRPNLNTIFGLPKRCEVNLLSTGIDPIDYIELAHAMRGDNYDGPENIAVDESLTKYLGG